MCTGAAHDGWKALCDSGGIKAHSRMKAHAQGQQAACAYLGTADSLRGHEGSTRIAVFMRTLAAPGLAARAWGRPDVKVLACSGMWRGAWVHHDSDRNAAWADNENVMHPWGRLTLPWRLQATIVELNGVEARLIGQQ